MTRVIVLCGGASDEREISLRSGASVAAALERAGYTVEQLDPADYPGEGLVAALAAADVVFPVLHGEGGEDGSIQELLERHGIPFVGTGSTASRICFDKAAYKQALAAPGITMPRGELVDAAAFAASGFAQAPYVLKPFDGGSSVDTFIVRDPTTADQAAIATAFARHGKLLIEELISGIEITVGVLGTKALPVVEIIPPQDGEFDYENKYNGKTSELCPAQNISEEVQQQARQLAEHIHNELGLRDMSRTDMIVRGGDDALYVLETNTIPGMTDQSLLPKEAAAAGYTMEMFVHSLVQAALDRRTTQRSN